VTCTGIHEFHALLDAAGELEVEARADRNGLGRRAMWPTLGRVTAKPTRFAADS
jgi:hypothetical protein